MKFFCLEELTASATALREGIDNRPSKCTCHLLHVLVDQLLDPIREAWGEPIVVSIDWDYQYGSKIRFNQLQKIQNNLFRQ